MKLYYVHDPMCSWCWAFRPVYQELKAKLPAGIEFIRLLGGLAPDSDEPMPEKTREYVIGNWRRIQEQLPKTQFNYDFWTVCQPRRSTYPSCRAVIAARKQGENFDEQMTHAIQKAYYLQARNPSDSGTLIELAEELGLNKREFSKDLTSPEVDYELKQELKLARELQLNSFPGFLLINGVRQIHVNPDYQSAEVILDKIQNS